MSKIYFIILSFLVFSSCCNKSKETARYELSQNELNLLPYKYGDSISFIHSNGYSFDFIVSNEELEWKVDDDFCEWFCCDNEYFSFQVRSYVLESSYPSLNIRIYIGGDVLGYYLPQTLNLSINFDHNIQFYYDSLTNYICDSTTKITHYDSISFNNKYFYNVYSKDFDSHGIVNNSSGILPQSLYLNNLGIIQIKMSNNETYTIND